MRDWVSLSQFWYQKKLGNFFLFIPPPNRVGGGSYRQGVSKRLLAGSMKFCPGRRVIYLLLKQSSNCLEDFCEGWEERDMSRLQPISICH